MCVLGNSCALYTFILTRIILMATRYFCVSTFDVGYDYRADVNYRKSIYYLFHLPPVQTCTIIPSSTPIFKVSSKVLHHYTSILHCELQVAAIDSSDVGKYMKFFTTSTRCLFHLSFRNTTFLQIAERMFFPHHGHICLQP